MGSGSRPATCASCGKRLSRKLWYYRNEKFFCKKRCFDTEQAKTDSAKAQAPQAKSAETKEQPKKPAEEASATS